MQMASSPVVEGREADLPRKQISSYSWQDEGFKLRVTFNFEAPILENQVC